MLEKVSKSPCSEDIAFAKTKEVAKRNRYKDKFPCEFYMSSLVLVVVVVYGHNVVNKESARSHNFSLAC